LRAVVVFFNIDVVIIGDLIEDVIVGGELVDYWNVFVTGRRVDVKCFSVTFLPNTV